MRKLLIAAALVTIGLTAREAQAHKINVFAYADGTTVHGEAYARGGEAIRGAKIEIFDPADGMKKLGEVVTGDDGTFTFQAQVRSDHRLVLSTGDGHAAEYTLPADELPETLPPPGGAEVAPAEPTEPPASPEAAPQPVAQTEPEHEPPPAEAVSGVSVETQLASLTRQVGLLRGQLEAYQEKMQFRDILGAIGYILGAMGLSYYFLGVKKKRTTAADRDTL